MIINLASMTATLSIVVLLFAGESWAQNPPEPDSTGIQREIVNRFIERFGIVPGVDTNGIVLGIGGPGRECDRLWARLTRADPVERIYELFERHGDLFQIQDARSELSLVGNPRRPDGIYSISLQQKVNGVAVERGWYSILIFPDSISYTLYEINGYFYPQARQVNTVPAITQAQAETIAMSDPEHGMDSVSVAASELLIAIYDGVPTLIWRVGLNGGAYMGAGVYDIDAQTGMILKVETGLVQ